MNNTDCSLWCLNYEELADGAAKLTRFEVPWDISARPHNKTCCCWRSPPTWRRGGLKGGLKMYDGIHLMQRRVLMNEVESCSGWNGSCTRWLQHSIPNQTTRAMELCHRHRLVLFLKAKGLFCIIIVGFFLSPLVLVQSLHCCNCNLPSSILSWPEW